MFQIRNQSFSLHMWLIWLQNCCSGVAWLLWRRSEMRFNAWFISSCICSIANNGISIQWSTHFTQSTPQNTQNYTCFCFLLSNFSAANISCIVVGESSSAAQISVQIFKNVNCTSFMVLAHGREKSFFDFECFKQPISFTSIECPVSHFCSSKTVQ